MSHARPVHPVREGLRSVLIGVFVNMALAATKAIAGVLGNSYALIADAIESTTDIASSVIVWSGLRIAVRPPDANHPYGHGKAEPLAAIVVSLALVVAAVGIAIQSVREIIVPHHAPAAFTLAVLVVVVLTKETLFRFVVRVGENTRSTAVKSDAWHHRSDAITSAAAFIGISIALIGGPGYESADDWAALFASGIIVVNALRILRPALGEVMDELPPLDIEESVRRVAQRVEEVVALEKCVVRKMGYSYFVELHVTVEGSHTVRHGHEIGRTVRQAVCDALPHVADVFIHLEPTDLIGERAGDHGTHRLRRMGPRRSDSSQP